MGRPRIHFDRKAYMKAYAAKWHAAHPLRGKADYIKYKDQIRTRRRKMKEYLDLLKSVPCMDCGQMFPPYVMDFDHRPGEIKLGSVPRVGSTLTARVKHEAEKCDVVCSNCHRVRTYNRLHTK